MPTECSQDSFVFASVEGRRVEAAFDGGAVTSDAGALLLEDFAHDIDVDTGNGNKGTDTENDQRDDDEKDSLAQFAQRSAREAAG